MTAIDEADPMTRQGLAVLGALGGAFISVLMVGIHLITLVVGAAVGWGFVALATRDRAPSPKSIPRDFNPDFATTSIAYNNSRQQLWTRPVRGAARVWDIKDIKSWNHTWTTVTNAFGKEFRRKSVIRFTTRDMSNPAFEISMNTYDEGAQWHARLDHWIND